MTLYLKGYQKYNISKLSFQLCPAVFSMPLEVECHTVPHLKALIRGIEHKSDHGQASTFRCQKISLKSSHFTS